MAGNLTAMIASIFSGGVTADPYYEYTTLLLPGNGTNGAQNNTFLDGSSNNFTITRNGNTTQGTFSPFSQTGWGNYFGSSTANLKFASVASFAIGTGNFSIECFVNFTAWSGTNQRICIQGVSGTTNVQIARDSGANDLFVDIQGSRVITYAWTPTIGQWYHIAVVRSGTGSNQVALYIDGTSVATGTSSASIAQNQFLIGGLDWASGYSLQGYISNFRYSNVARTITLPTSAYTSDANTLILTCQSNRFIDNSASPKTITVNGSPSVQAFSPFNPTASWSAATYGGSGYFDGNGDYLATASNAAFALGSGNFTIEMWLYSGANGTGTRLAGNGTGGSWAANRWIMATSVPANVNKFVLATNNYGGDMLVSTSTFNNNQWMHVAIARSGNAWALWVNGTREAYIASNSSAVDGGTSEVFNLGRSNLSGDSDWNGYVSGFKMVKGTAVYDPASTSITIPTAPPTNTTNTSLLLNFTNAGIYDATSKLVLETVNSASLSNAIAPKWGSTSIKFASSTSDYLWSNNQPAQVEVIGTSDFTIEGWVYLSTINTAFGIISRGTSTTGWSVNITSGNKLQFSYTASSLVGATSLVQNTWYYFAVVRSGSSSGNLKLYLSTGGAISSADATSAGAVTDNFNQTNAIYVGADRVGTSLLNGYLQDIRLTNYARTITAAPTAAFPTL
jgi:hypothetical protein